MNLRYTDRALDDIEVALVWYERQRNGLGLEFLDCVERAILRILENPEAHRIRYKHFRACIVRRFPFAVYYTIERDALVVHSVFHQHRDPSDQP